MPNTAHPCVGKADLSIYISHEADTSIMPSRQPEEHSFVDLQRHLHASDCWRNHLQT